MEEVGKRLLQAVKRGNCHAFEKVVQHYEGPVYQFSYVCMKDSVLAEVLARDTFIHAHNIISDYHQKDTEFSVWLFQINLCLCRKRMKEIHQIECDSSFLSVFLEERISLFLYHVYHLAFPDIGKVLGKREVEIKELLVDGRENLREREECEEQKRSG